MESELPGWEYLSDLGKHYVNLVSLGYGTTLENRCPEQLWIADRVVRGSLPFMKKISGKLLKTGWKIKTPNGPIKLRVNKASIGFNELVSEGTFSLLNNLKNYNPDYSISSFIGIRCPADIVRATDGTIVHVPGYRADQLRKILTINRPGEGGLDDAIEAIFDNLTTKSGKRRIDRFRTANLAYASLTGDYVCVDPELVEEEFEDLELTSDGYFHELGEIPEADSEIITCWECVADDSFGVNPHEVAEGLDRELVIASVLDGLTPREGFILRQRFGLNGNEPKSLEEVGSELLITRERVRQIEAKAIRKLRYPLNQNILEQI